MDHFHCSIILRQGPLLSPDNRAIEAVRSGVGASTLTAGWLQLHTKRPGCRYIDSGEQNSPNVAWQQLRLWDMVPFHTRTRAVADR